MERFRSDVQASLSFPNRLKGDRFPFRLLTHFFFLLRSKSARWESGGGYSSFSIAEADALGYLCWLDKAKRWPKISMGISVQEMVPHVPSIQVRSLDHRSSLFLLGTGSTTAK